MPYLYKEVQRTVTETVGFECSKCLQQFDVEDIEFQERLHWRSIGGYGSVWGDGSVIEVDLCQHCTYELLKDFATVHEN